MQSICIADLILTSLSQALSSEEAGTVLILVNITTLVLRAVPHPQQSFNKYLVNEKRETQW